MSNQEQEIPQEIKDKLFALTEKFDKRGQDIGSYLDGLLHSEFLTYWDYVHLDTLLSLQTPRTIYPDENIFIIYHQITELYFRLVLQEQDYICSTVKTDKWDIETVIVKLKRINNYMRALVHSFGIMIDGMDRDQFMKFRLALLPASGFQSAQYRKIEMYASDIGNLVVESKRKETPDLISEDEITALYADIYWKYGATVAETGEKSLTLKMFEEKYDKELLALLHQLKYNNFNHLITEGYLDENNAEIKSLLRTFDILVNVDWPFVHFKSAVRYLKQAKGDVPATGGTNWQQYLPPKFQKRIFFPSLWTEQEKAEWGKNWVENALRIK